MADFPKGLRMRRSLPHGRVQDKRHQTQPEQRMQSFILSTPAGFRGGRIRPEGRAGRAGRRVRPGSGRGRGWWRGIRAFRALRADGGRIYHNPAAVECYKCATFSCLAISPATGRIGAAAARGAAAGDDLATGRLDDLDQVGESASRQVAKGRQTFARMSGMLDLSRDEKAKHRLPR